MNFKKFPHEIIEVEYVKNRKMIKEFTAQSDGFVQVGSEKWILPKRYTEYAELIYNFEARPDDVFICTFPRSGTTWTQEMIWLICNNLNYETATEKELFSRFPFLE